MLKSLLYIIPLGCFCVLAVYSMGRYVPASSTRAKPVAIKRDVRCDQADWVCLVAWAAEEHPVKRGRK